MGFNSEFKGLNRNKKYV